MVSYTDCRDVINVNRPDLLLQSCLKVNQLGGTDLMHVATCSLS